MRTLSVTNPVLDRADERFVAHTTAASTIVRHLGFVAVAIIWLFGSGGTGPDLVPHEVLRRIHASDALSISLILVLCSLVLDLAQYFWGATTWGAYHWLLDQLLADVRTSPMTWRERIAWHLARLTGFKRKLDLDLGLLEGGEKTRPSVESTRRALVHAKVVAATEVWSPAFINWVTNVLFFSKVISMGGAYASLLYFVLQ